MTKPKDTPKINDPVEVVPGVVERWSSRKGGYYPEGVHTAVAPTQVRRPWRSTARTIFQATVALAGMWAVVVAAAGLPDWAWVGSSVAIAGGITRVMALPGVETWLRRFLPFLAAAPTPKG